MIVLCFSRASCICFICAITEYLFPASGLLEPTLRLYNLHSSEIINFK